MCFLFKWKFNVLDKKIVAFYNCSTAISIDQLQVAMKGKPVEYHPQYFTAGSLPTGITGTSLNSYQ